MHHFYMKATWTMCGNDRFSHYQILNVNLLKRGMSSLNLTDYDFTHPPVAAVKHQFVATIMKQRRQNILCVNIQYVNVELS